MRDAWLKRVAQNYIYNAPRAVDWKNTHASTHSPTYIHIYGGSVHIVDTRLLGVYFVLLHFVRNIRTATSATATATNATHTERNGTVVDDDDDDGDANKARFCCFLPVLSSSMARVHMQTHTLALCISGGPSRLTKATSPTHHPSYQPMSTPTSPHTHARSYYIHSSCTWRPAHSYSYSQPAARQAFVPRSTRRETTPITATNAEPPLHRQTVTIYSIFMRVRA